MNTNMTEPSKQQNKFTPPINSPTTASAPLPSSTFTTPAKYKAKSEQHTKALTDLKDTEPSLSTVPETETEYEPDSQVEHTSRTDPHIDEQEMKREFDLAMLQMQNELQLAQQQLYDTQQQNAYLEYQARSRYQNPPDAPSSMTATAFINAVGKPDKFTGDFKSNPATWIDTMRDYMHLTGMAVHLHSAFAVSYLSGPAREWYSSFSQENRIKASNFETLAEMILARYRPVDAARTARIKLTSLRQTTSVDAYNTLFIQTIQLITNMSFDDQLHHYRNGLKPQILEKVILMEFSSLNEVMNAAARLDHLMYAMKRTSNDYSNANRYGIGMYGNGNRNGTNASTPMEVNNVNAGMFTDSQMEHDGDISVNAVRFQKLTPAERQQLMKEGRCFRCRERGHMSNACPKNNGSGMKPSAPISNSKKQ
jgi:hypothetical protein